MLWMPLAWATHKQRHSCGRGMGHDALQTITFTITLDRKEFHVFSPRIHWRCAYKRAVRAMINTMTARAQPQNNQFEHNDAISIIHNQQKVHFAWPIVVCACACVLCFPHGQQSIPSQNHAHTLSKSISATEHLSCDILLRICGDPFRGNSTCASLLSTMSPSIWAQQRWGTLFMAFDFYFNSSNASFIFSAYIKQPNEFRMDWGKYAELQHG